MACSIAGEIAEFNCRNNGNVVKCGLNYRCCRGVGVCFLPAFAFLFLSSLPNSFPHAAAPRAIS